MDTSTLIQAKKQARNLLNKLIKLDGLDPAQKKALTNINKQVHYQIKQLNREEELKMKTIELNTWESDRFNGEWDYTLHGIQFETPEELKAAFQEWPSIAWLPKLDFNCSEYRLNKLTKSGFQSLADQARNTYEFERLEGEEYDQAYKLLDELDAQERELYSEFI